MGNTVRIHGEHSEETQNTKAKRKRTLKRASITNKLKLEKRQTWIDKYMGRVNLIARVVRDCFRIVQIDE